MFGFREQAVPIWATQKMSIAEWGTIQFRMDLARMRFRTLPLHMAMLRKAGPLGDRDDVFILLPDLSMMPKFTEFVVMGEPAEIPAGCSMLIGDPETFAKLYPALEGVTALPLSATTETETAEPI